MCERNYRKQTKGYYMKITELKDKIGLTVALKVKRFCRFIRRPFIKTKLDFSASLYKNENEAVPAASIDGDLDHSIKLADIAAVLAVMLAFLSFLRAIGRIFC